MLAGGPISKWDSRPPDLDYVSATDIFVAERCLIDLKNMQAPSVYWQPDRPGEVNVLWSDQYGFTGIRVHLLKSSDGTRVTAWKLKDNKVLECAPPK